MSCQENQLFFSYFLLKTGHATHKPVYFFLDFLITVASVTLIWCSKGKLSILLCFTVLLFMSGCSSLWKMIFFFRPVCCRSGPVWTALCSCRSSHHELQGSRPWCWPTTAWRVSSGSSRKSQRCPAWRSSWWCGITRIRVLLRVSRAHIQHKGKLWFIWWA